MATTAPDSKYLTRRAFLKSAIKISGGATIALAGGTGYGFQVEPHWLDVNHVSLILPNLQPAFHNYRIVQISDLHAGSWLKRDQLQDAITMVNAESPDLIVITGDFVTTDPYASADDLTHTLGGLSAKDGVFYVMGNHDHWAGVGMVREILAPLPITELENATHTIERGSSLLTIAGVDDIWEQKNRLDAVLGKVPSEGAAILLAHEPDYADEASAANRFDLQLSGHSHGGQFVIPFVGPPKLPPYGIKYHTGLYKVGNMIQYTNRGIGMIPPYVRFNCRPEITVFNLQSAG